VNIFPLLISDNARICEWSAHNNAVFDVNWIKVGIDFAIGLRTSFCYFFDLIGYLFC
jgi:hypothetical protein